MKSELVHMQGESMGRRSGMDDEGTCGFTRGSWRDGTGMVMRAVERRPAQHSQEHHHECQSCRPARQESRGVRV